MFLLCWVVIVVGVWDRRRLGSWVQSVCLESCIHDLNFLPCRWRGGRCRGGCPCLQRQGGVTGGEMCSLGEVFA